MKYFKNQITDSVQPSIKKFYIKIILFYLFAVILSGILLNVIMLFPRFLGTQTNAYFILKLFHQNAFMYGMVFNILPGIYFFFALKKTEILFYKKTEVYCFWFYQFSVLLGIGGNILGFVQPIRFLEFEWLPKIFITCLILLFLIFATRYYLFDSTKKYIWMFYILIPLTIYFLFFLILNLNRPVGILSSYSILPPFYRNLFSLAFQNFVLYYFLGVFTFGILYFLYTDTGNMELLKSMKIQWLLHTVFFVIFLYFQIQNQIYRQDKSIGFKISVVSICTPYFIGIINLRSLKSALRDREQKIFGLMAMFLQIFIFGNILGNFGRMHELLLFTDWEIAQHHLLFIGFLLPALILFLVKMYSISYFSNRIFALWWIFTLIIAVSGWSFGVAESGLLNKMDAYGFLEYPGSAEIGKFLRPYYLVRFLAAGSLFLILIFLISPIRKIKRIFYNR